MSKSATQKLDAPAVTELEPDPTAEPEWVSRPWLPAVTSPFGFVTAIALGSAAAVWVWSAGGPGSITVIVQTLFAVLLAVLAVIDIAVQRLPDALVLPAYPIALGALAIAAASGEISWITLAVAVACGAVLSLTFYLIAALTGGMGWGDVKLVGLIGLVLGVSGIGNAIAGGFLLPSLCAIPVLFVVLLFSKGCKSIAFGPLLALGAVLAMAFHAPLTAEFNLVWSGLVD